MAFIAFLSPQKIKMRLRSFFKGIFKKMGVFIAFLKPQKNIWAKS